MATTDNQVNTTTYGQQHSPSIAYLAGGGWVVVWTGPGLGDSSLDATDGIFPVGGVFYQLYNANGEKVGSETLVNQNVNPENLYPEVVALTGGGFGIAWVEYYRNNSPAPNTSHYEYYARAYDANGNAQSGPKLINEQTFGTSNDNGEDILNVFATSDGGFSVVFQEPDWTANPEVESVANSIGTGYDPVVLVQQKMNANGSKNGANFVMEESHVGQYTPVAGGQQLIGDDVYYNNWAAAVLTDGNQAIAWYGYNEQDTSTPAGSYLYVKIDDASGGEVAGVHRVNDNFFKADNPDIAALDNGEFVVVWLQSVSGGHEIHAQRFDSDGTELGSEITVSADAAIDQAGTPKVAQLESGGFVVVWDELTDSSNFKSTAFAQIYNASGVAQGGPIEVVTGIGYIATEMAVAATPDGGFLISWDETVYNLSTLQISSNELYQKRFDSSGAEVALGGVAENRDATFNMKEDKVFTFDRDDFGYSDALGGPFSKLKIKSLPAHGVLKLDGVKVAKNDLIAKSDITKLTFKPAKDWFGKTDFDFQVKDAGGLSATFTLKFKIKDVVDKFIGNNNKNTLKGTAGKDILDGKKGNDTLTGKAGKDKFVFKTGWDKDKITDFDAKGSDHDIVDLRGLKSVTSFNDLKKHHLFKSGHDVLIKGGHGDVLTLKNVKIGDLDSHDFLI